MDIGYKNIVVAVDGSSASDRALKKAISIAKRNKAKLILAHVIDSRTFAVAEAYDTHMAMRSDEYANNLLTHYQKQALQAGVDDVEIQKEYGSPKIKIAKEIAVKCEADLIICGATGLNAMERLLIGSVSQHITRYATCDVLVVRNTD